MIYIITNKQKEVEHVRTIEVIKHAFSFGKGTIKDLKRYCKDNKLKITIIK